MRRVLTGQHPVWLVAILSVLAATATARGIVMQLPLDQCWQALRHPNLDDPRQLLLDYSFLPRLVVSLLCGAALALAGAIFQQVMRNPLAEPTTLGVSAGASLALTLALAFAPGTLAYGRDWIALVGAAFATVAVFALAWNRALSPFALVLAGMIVGLYCGALAGGVQLFENPYLRSFYLWGAGSLSQQDWSITLYLLPRIGAAVIVIALIVRPLTVLGLDDEGARSLGVSLFGVRLVALTVAVALSAFVVSAVGIIGFIGLAAPALVRLAGARRFASRLLWAPILGAVLLCLTDQLVQWLANGDRELVPTGAATALLGAPLMLWMLPRLRTGPEPFRNSTPDPMRRARHPWRAIALAMLILLLLLYTSLHLGQNGQGWHWDSPRQLMPVLQWRAPRLVGAVAAGAMLAMAGTLMQRLTGNPMASPEILGVSGGAALALIVLLMLSSHINQTAELSACAFGAFASLAIILLLARRSDYAPDRILLAGIALGALSSVLLLVFMASGSAQVSTLQNWMAGSTDLLTSNQAAFAAGVAAILLALAPLLRRWLVLLPLGSQAPRALGLDVARARLLVLAFTALLTAAATLTVGPLGFVGLMGPHLARMMGLHRPLQQLIGAAVLGGLIMTAADWLGRTILFPYEVPAGLIATLIGGPYLMGLLRRRPVGQW